DQLPERTRRFTAKSAFSQFHDVLVFSTRSSNEGSSACHAQSVVNGLAGVATRLAFTFKARIIAAVKPTFGKGRGLVVCGAVLIYAAAAFAQSSSNGFLSRGDLMPVSDSGAINHRSDCKARFAALVRDLDGV